MQGGRGCLCISVEVCLCVCDFVCACGFLFVCYLISCPKEINFLYIDVRTVLYIPACLQICMLKLIGSVLFNTFSSKECKTAALFISEKNFCGKNYIIYVLNHK